jgi:hypothetical protein
MSPARLTASLGGAGTAPVFRTREDEMYPCHPIAAFYLARLQLEEDIARAAAHRTARQAAAARKAARRARPVKPAQ